MNPFVPLENPAEVVSILSSISLFGGVSEAQQQEIFSRLEIGSFKKGAFIFQKGDEPSHIYIVKKGLIELFIPDHEAMIEKKKLGTGECFGQVALMSIHRHTISAVAIEDSEIIVFSKRLLHRLHQEDLALFALLMMNIARELARRLQFTDEMLIKSFHGHGHIPPVAKISGP